MKEQNYKTLRDAINRLPQYDADTSVWSHIEEALDIADADNQIKSAIPELPVYDAPDFVWENIEATLDQNSTSDTSSTTAKRRQLMQWIPAAAAAVVLLLAIALWGESDDPRITTSYSEEIAVGTFDFSLDSEDESAFEMIAKFCEGGLAACQQIEFIELKKELVELNEARDELSAAITAFTTDKNLMAQLTAIELERSDILKKMMSKINPVYIVSN